MDGTVKFARGVSTLASVAVVGLGAVAGLRRRGELARERDGRLESLRPDTATTSPWRQGVLATRIAGWQPELPRTPLARAAGFAWTAPSTVVGLVLSGAGGGTITWNREVGAFVATGVGGLSAIMLRSFGMTANTLGHTVVCTRDEVSQRLLDHEAVHVRQFERLGLAFYPLYLWLSARHGYRDNPIEVAARRGAARAVAARHPLDPTTPGLRP